MFALHSTQYSYFKVKIPLQKRTIFSCCCFKLQLLLSLLLRSFLSLAIKGVFYILNYCHYTLLFNILVYVVCHSLSTLFSYISIFLCFRYYTLKFSFFHFLFMLKIYFSSLTSLIKFVVGKNLEWSLMQNHKIDGVHLTNLVYIEFRDPKGR